MEKVYGKNNNKVKKILMNNKRKKIKNNHKNRLMEMIKSRMKNKKIRIKTSFQIL